MSGHCTRGRVVVDGGRDLQHANHAVQIVENLKLLISIEIAAIVLKTGA